MTDKTNKELYAELHAILKKSTDAIVEAEKFAEANKLEFRLRIPGVAISYYPHSLQVRSEHGEGLTDNNMITDRLYDNLDEGEEIVYTTDYDPNNHETVEFYSDGYGRRGRGFEGGYWIPSRFC